MHLKAASKKNFNTGQICRPLCRMILPKLRGRGIPQSSSRRKHGKICFMDYVQAHLIAAVTNVRLQGRRPKAENTDLNIFVARHRSLLHDQGGGGAVEAIDTAVKHVSFGCPRFFKLDCALGSGEPAVQKKFHHGIDGFGYYMANICVGPDQVRVHGGVLATKRSDLVVKNQIRSQMLIDSTRRSARSSTRGLDFRLCVTKVSCYRGHTRWRARHSVGRLITRWLCGGVLWGG
mmetsp:Transcript_14325/g.36594  ORF Transcript_14325/g.36594 Transcript_14325/m.36594 type:complete len:233 (-) Transcript_14325:20-718(-)